MPFNNKDLVWLLKKLGLTDLEIALDAGISERKVRTLKKAAGTRYVEQQLERIFTERCRLPWSHECHAQLRYMHSLFHAERWNDLDRAFAFSAGASFDIAMKLGLRSEVSERVWGHALVAYTYKLCMQYSKLGSHQANRDGWEEIVDVMVKLLEGHDEPWARLLRFKVLGNRIVIAWKRATPRESRASEQMKKLIDESGYREALIAFNELVPADSVAPFNALAIASRLGEQHHYEDLLRRLVRADKSYRDIGRIRDPDFDDDFEDFRLWHAMRAKEVA